MSSKQTVGRLSFKPLQALFCMTNRPQSTLLVFVVAALMFAGCGKKKAAQTVAPPPASAETQPAPPGQPAPIPVQQPATSLTQANGQVDMPELQRSVLRWILANQRRPANFEDFAATAGVQIPPPPAGKKYILTKDMHVRLVDR